MLKTLWSGLTGLAAHQQALDVESNNIANANTDGFKYSKVGFEDLVNQTYNTSSAPSDALGGINATQIGLGVKVSSIEKVFSQGPIETTDRITDLSIQGDGFFMVSEDNGETKDYTRAGQFKFDANGTLVNNNGLKVLGWNAEHENYTINSSNRLETMTIEPNMKIDAKATNELVIRANLNNGSKVKELSSSSHPYSKYTDFNDLYNSYGNKLLVEKGNNITVSFIDPAGGPNRDVTYTYGKGNDFKSMGDIVDLINNDLRDPIGEDYSRNVFLDGKGRLADNDGIIDTITSNNSFLNELFSSLASSRTSEPLKNDKTGFFASEDIAELYTIDGNKINLKSGEGITVEIEGLKEPRNFVYREKDVSDFNNRFNMDGDYQLNQNLTNATGKEGFHWTKDANGNPANLNVGDTISINYQDSKNVGGGVTKTLSFKYGTDFSSMEELVRVINDGLPQGETGFLELDETTGQIKKVSDFIQNITVTSALDNSGNPLRNIGGPNGLSNFSNMLSTLKNTNTSAEFFQNNTYYFSDTQNLENLIQLSINQSGDPLINPNSNKANVLLNENGQITVDNIGNKTFGINISGYPDVQHENKAFTNIMMGLNALSVPGNELQSRSMKAATHIISTDVFDTFGNSHPVDMKFTKAETSNDNGFIVWNWKSDIKEPAILTGTTSGEVRFSPDGSLYSYTPATLTFLSNNSPQGIPTTFNLDFGNVGDLTGLTSQDDKSETSKITQDGYTHGELEDVTIDKFGTIQGTFSNGISKSLAQIGLATFTNNAGLENLGGNLYRNSSNSGEPDITTALKPGVGSVLSSSLEKSNVDLSKALVAMIVFQRGFQANSKTITTADEILKELIGLKR